MDFGEIWRLQRLEDSLDKLMEEFGGRSVVEVARYVHDRRQAEEYAAYRAERDAALKNAQA